MRISAFRVTLTLSILVFVASLLMAPLQVNAQNVASITGVVTDQSGAVMPGVEVTLINTSNGDTYHATTNDAGSYTITEVKPGPGYKIQFTRDGFKTVDVSGIYMNVDASRTQNAQLTAGGSRETIEVSAASQNVTLDTTDATVGNSFQVQTLNDLPVQDRSNPSALFVTQPGVTLDGAVTGARVDQSRVTVDGADVNDMGTGVFGYIVGRAPVDSVQEFRGVSAGDLSSEAGGGGGQYTLVTKSGTNAFHGSLVEYHRDTAMEANDWFNNNAGVARPPLIRNQFGGNIGGPIMKNKMFFFFDYNGRRDTLSNLENRTVPLDSFRGGSIAYIRNDNTVAMLSPAQVTALDPLHAGFNSSLADLFNSRYPHANDFSGSRGDLLNTAGYRFNAPFPYKEDDYVQRVDFYLNEKVKFWGKGNFVRTNATQSAIQFPGDPVTSPFIDRSYVYVIGNIWTINSRMVNNASYGKVYENFNFPNTYNPTGVTQYGSMGGNGTGGSILSSPYASAINAQGRTYPIPFIRDDFSWDKGKHSFRFGGTFKWITPQDYTILNYNSPSIGLGGFTTALGSGLEPGDICPSSDNNCGYAPGLFDPAFALALAPYTAVGSTFNYDAQGNALQQGSGSSHTYKYYETELYFGDTWKVHPKLTLSYGLRWINYSVPYDTHGIQSIQNFDFNTYFNDRVAQSAASQSGNTAVPLIAYSLGGKANHAPGYFQPQYKNFGPRLGFAYQLNPKTVINGGAGVLFDQTVINAVQYQQSQFSYLFQASATQPFGVPNDPFTSLQTDQRFTGVDNPPTPPTAPTITKPFYPFVDFSSGSPVPGGLANGGAFNEIIDPKLKTPYSIQFNLGVEHEIPGGFLMKLSYVGRLGRRLLAQADANQLIDFRDPVSGQTMGDAFANITQQLRAGGDPSNPVPQPWFENVFFANSGANLGLPNNTALATLANPTLVARGDFADWTQLLSFYDAYFNSNYGVDIGLPPNVGMGSQFSENTFYTNKGSSSYNGLLATLHKNAGHGLQFDLNYTWSHSIDNVSLIANAAAFSGYGFVCDVLRPRECRSNSDFDVTHYFSGYFIYDLPFGRGKAFGGASPSWLNEIIGGWSASALPSAHSGGAYFAAANAFVAGYANNAPAILTGPISDLKVHLNGGHGQALNAYANTSQANSDFVGPLGFNIGARNNLRGPSYFDMDAGAEKSFPLGTERFALKFRADAFNVFNHPNFANPCNDITNVSCLFGTISSTVGTTIRNSGPSARVLQLALRLEF